MREGGREIKGGSREESIGRRAGAGDEERTVLCWEMFRG